MPGGSSRTEPEKACRIPRAVNLLKLEGGLRIRSNPSSEL